MSMHKKIGTNGIIHFIGVVEDVKDPEQLGRVRVRCYGHHTEDKGILPTEMLPWSIPIQPITSAASLGVGTSPTGMDIGTTVVGYFADGHEGQFPFIWGTYAGKPKGKNDLAKLATGTNTLDKKYVDPYEPHSQYGTQYPNNQVSVTKAGHVVEIDSTGGKERIQIWHKAGTYLEISPNGQLVIKTTGNSYDITTKDHIGYVGGVANVTIVGNAWVTCKGQLTANVSGDTRINTQGNLEITVAKNLTFTVGGDVNWTIGGDETVSAGKTQINNDVDVSGDVVAGDISLQHHKHSGVQRGPGNTDPPIG